MRLSTYKKKVSLIFVHILIYPKLLNQRGSVGYVPLSVII